jgi:putative endonuclease
MQAAIYILANMMRGTLYIGVTSDLLRLVHFESCDDIPVAITRERQLKRWHRDWKIGLIEQTNPSCAIWRRRRVWTLKQVQGDSGEGSSIPYISPRAWRMAYHAFTLALCWASVSAKTCPPLPLATK